MASMTTIQLIPNAPTLLGIVCTICHGIKDENGMLQSRLTVRLPVWDENDSDLYLGKLTPSGHGIVVTMPATAFFLRNTKQVKKITKYVADGDIQVGLQHTWYCNQFTADNQNTDRTVQALLLFPKGQAFNNGSFNTSVKATDFYKLQRKFCSFYETTKNGRQVIRTAVGFEVAMDKEEGILDVSTDQPKIKPKDGLSEVLAMLAIQDGDSDNEEEDEDDQEATSSVNMILTDFDEDFHSVGDQGKRTRGKPKK